LWTRSLCQRASSLVPPDAGASAGRPPSATTPSSSRLLRVQGARKSLLAGSVTRSLCVAAANVHELSVLRDLVERTSGVVVGDRNYWSPANGEGLTGRGVELAAPNRNKKRDPHPARSAFLSRARYRIDAVFDQLWIDSPSSAYGRVTRSTWRASCCAKYSATSLPSCSTIGRATRPCSYLPGYSLDLDVAHGISKLLTRL
jgi:hypothetical protein